ncbi:GIY-YIG nuclease family protein [Streptomyces goshikiensis]|uniref:GIY-YIG nuclease family protein n=1 Tax=Streptomyces goshikiensis TaxID=1942 RepID=UPI0037900A6A
MTRKATRRDPDRVYLIGDAKTMKVKIGIASDPKRRLSEIQTGNPARLVIFAVFHGNARTERALHKRFATRRLSGEWFDFVGLDPVQAVTAAGLTRDFDYPLWEAEDPEAYNKHFVRTIEAAHDMSTPKGFRRYGKFAVGLGAAVAIYALVLTWAADGGLLPKIMYSVTIPVFLGLAVKQDIENRTLVLDYGLAVGAMYAMAGLFMVAPGVGYAWDSASASTGSRVLDCMYVGFMFALAPLVIHMGLESFYPELDDRVKERIRADRRKAAQVEADKTENIRHARSLRRYYELRGEPLGPPGEGID